MSDPSIQPGGGTPPHPQWIAAPPPWTEPGWRSDWASGQGQSIGSAGWMPAPPSEVPAPNGPRAWGRAGVAATVIATAVALVVGVGLGSRVRLIGSRPTLSTASVVPGVSPTTVLPKPPVVSTPPADQGGSVPGNGQLSPSGPATPTPNAAVPAQAAAIAAKVDPAIVDINTVLGYQGGAGAGTGMVISSTGEILTNNHVVDGATSISVTFVTTGRVYGAQVVGTDPTQDVAVLKLQGVTGLPTIAAGDSAKVAVGDAVVAIGNAGGLGGAPAVVTGTVQALNQTITASDPGGANAETLNGLIQTSTPIQPGDSGGPLVNANAQVIGIDTAAQTGRRFSSAASAGFAIPIAQALSIAQQIGSGQATSTVHIGLPAFLGVALQRTGTGQSATGAVVSGTEPGTPAARAGLVAGDVITAVDSQTVDSAPALSSLLRSHRPGDKVKLSWSDGSGAAQSATVTLAVGPAD